MAVTLIAVLFGVTGAGLLLLKVGGWYFEHRSGSAKSVGAAGVLIGFAFLILAIAIICPPNIPCCPTQPYRPDLPAFICAVPGFTCRASPSVYCPTGELCCSDGCCNGAPASEGTFRE